MVPLIQIVVGSTRPGRFADKPLSWLVDRLGPREDLAIETVDLRDHPLPMYALAVPPTRSLREYPDEAVGALGRTLDRADGYIVVTSEYNHGYPASLKNALDHVFVELNRKPVAFVGYGGAGGARAVEQLRQVAVEFEMAPIRQAVHILPDVMLPAMGDEPFTVEVFAPLDGRLELLAGHLLWWATALATARVEA